MITNKTHCNCKKNYCLLEGKYLANNMVYKAILKIENVRGIIYKVATERTRKNDLTITRIYLKASNMQIKQFCQNVYGRVNIKWYRI